MQPMLSIHKTLSQLNKATNLTVTPCQIQIKQVLRWLRTRLSLIKEIATRLILRLQRTLIGNVRLDLGLFRTPRSDGLQVMMMILKLYQEKKKNMRWWSHTAKEYRWKWSTRIKKVVKGQFTLRTTSYNKVVGEGHDSKGIGVFRMLEGIEMKEILIGNLGEPSLEIQCKRCLERKISDLRVL